MRKFIAVALAVVGLAVPATASAATAVLTTSTGYQITLTGPDTARVGDTATYTATCGPVGYYGSPCPYGAFRMFGGPINRLGEGFGIGAIGRYTFRGAGFYQANYRVGASCPGSPRLACPLNVWIGTSVT